ncbi:MAG: trypsin-like peptidase domain-containing protein [Acidimicrobiia bacterium]|nr:trypsin-like peptidase domain-containing protein [Acidimicrobiia bacterium]
MALALLAGSCANLTRSGGDTATESTPVDDTTSGDSGDGSGAEPAEDNCPELASMLGDVNAATYAVYGEAIVNPGAGPELVHFQIGSAWAAGRRLLVTNAHITQAFVEFARQGVQLERAIAIQAGTGEVVTLLRELTHPEYDGDPLRSPDVGLFTTQQELPSTLELASPTVEIALGDEIQIVGFPGDVTDFIEIVPGETVPQATSLSGDVTALRTHDDTEAVTADNLDVIQHQAPTTPGTSGSSMVACGKVIGVNNAGTVNLIATPAPDGSLTIDRQAAAANNFGVHVHHIAEMVGLFEDNAVQGNELPLEAEVVVAAPPDMPIDALTLLGTVTGDQYAHAIEIVVADDGTITGASTWGENQYSLSGQIFEDGTLFFIDDAPELSTDLRRGFYEGTVVSDTRIEGVYFEEGQEDVQAPFSADLQ